MFKNKRKYLCCLWSNTNETSKGKCQLQLGRNEESSGFSENSDNNSGSSDNVNTIK